MGICRGKVNNGGFDWLSTSAELIDITKSMIGVYSPRSRIMFDCTQLVAGQHNDVLHMTYIHQPTTGRGTYTSQVTYLRSEDGCLTWTTPLTLSGPVCHGSRIVRSGTGRLTVAWYDLTDETLRCRISEDDGAAWGDEFVIGPVSLNEGTTSPGNYSSQHYHYDPRYYCGAEIHALDFPSMAIDQSGGERDGWIYLVWTEAATGVVQPITWRINERELNDTFGTANPIQPGWGVYGLSESPDWHMGETDYFSFHLDTGQTISISGELTGFSHPGSGIERGCRIVLVSGPDGQDITSTQIVHASQGGTSPLVISAPVDGQYAMRFPSNGSPYSTSYYLEMATLTPDPGSASRDHRDIVMVVSQDGGRTWSSKVRVNDDPPGYDNALPQVTVDRYGVAHVAWYDRSEDAERGRGMSVRASSTADGGLTFTPSQKFNQASTDSFFLQSAVTIGDKFAFQAHGDSLYALWTEVVGVSRERYQPVLPISGLVGRVMPLFNLKSQVTSLTGVDFGSSARIIGALSGDIPSGRVGLWRQVDGGAWVEIGERELHGSGTYVLTDGSPPSGVRAYRLLFQPEDGFSEWSDPVTELDDQRSSQAPLVLLMQNPSMGVVSFRVIPPEAGPVTISVHDVAGRQVRKWRLDDVAPDGELAVWDGRGADGRAVAAGRYFLRVATERESRSVSVTLVR